MGPLVGEDGSGVEWRNLGIQDSQLLMFLTVLYQGHLCRIGEINLGQAGRPEGIAENSLRVRLHSQIVCMV